jgi:hypothetical protein
MASSNSNTNHKPDPSFHPFTLQDRQAVLENLIQHIQE